MSLSIQPLTRKDVERFHDHFRRHRVESGRGDHHFMPFAPGDPRGPSELDVDAIDRPVTAPGWQRWFVAVTDRDEIVGHVDLKGDALRTGLHRCELGRQVGISEAMFYAWKKKYAHLGVSELRRLRQIEEENTRLKRLVADLSLDKHMLSEALRKTV